MSNSTRRKKTILFLAANPKNSTPLDLTRELKEIEAGLQRSQKRDKFQLKQEWAVTPTEVHRAMLDYKPQIVHFSGHGLGDNGLVLEDEVGQAQVVNAMALASTFKQFAQQVECVVLNACYSHVQAIAIAQHISHVVGMNQSVGDRAARMFAVGFYDALAAGESIDFAYEYGQNRIALQGIPEHLIPVLLRQSDLKAETAPPPDASADSDHAPDISSSPTPIVPSPAVLWDEPEGQVPLDSPFYVERPPNEERCYQAITKPGALIRIKAPRQMGKSSLTIRVLAHAKQQGYRETWLNLQSTGKQSLFSLDSFLQWLCRRVSQKLQLQDRVADYWQSQSFAASTDKCTDYFRLYLLEATHAPLALCLDEVDVLFKHPEIASDFFGLLRSWHEESKINPVWQHLRLVITHSDEVYIPLNITQSPFNVGVSIELPPFTTNQVADLINRHGLAWSNAEQTAFMSLVGGHPYLTRLALNQIARGYLTLAEFSQLSPTLAGPFASHLRRHLSNLEEHRLAIPMQQIVFAEQPMLSDSAATKLANMGLVRYQGNQVVPLCELYRRYFRDVLQ
jgi:hypothetical protein